MTNREKEISKEKIKNIKISLDIAAGQVSRAYSTNNMGFLVESAQNVSKLVHAI